MATKQMDNSNKPEVLAVVPLPSAAMQDTDAMIGIGGRWWRFPGARIDTDSWEVEWRSDGKQYLHDEAGKVVEGIEVDKPQDVAGVLAIPSPQERTRREIMLTRLMLVAIDLVLSGERLGLETARDLIREVRHAYPELAAERGEL